MGSLGGFNYKTITKKLKKLGFEKRRQAKGSHEIWQLPGTDRVTTVPNHVGDMPEGTLRAILKQCSISIDEFRSA